MKLLQGDLAEAWREGDKEYASVAMRYSLVDRYVDRATGRVAEGNDAPQEATEVWTFTRAHGGKLAALGDPAGVSHVTHKRQRSPAAMPGFCRFHRRANAVQSIASR